MTASKRIGIMALGILFLLMIPLIAMQFNTGVNWSAFDFLVMGALLLLLAMGLEFIIRRSKKRSVRYMLIALLLLVFFLVWAELAVGIFNSPLAGS